VGEEGGAGRVRRGPGPGLISLMIVAGLALVFLGAMAIISALTDPRDTERLEGQVDELRDRTAQDSLADAAAIAESMYSDSFAAVTLAQLREAEPDLAFVEPDQPSTGPRSVSALAEDQVFAAAARSASGRCFVLRLEGSSATTTYGQGPRGGPCTGAQASREATQPSW